MSQLRVSSSILSGTAFPLDGEYFTIGREPDNHIQLNHTSISKHHAILKIDDGDFKLFDLHSTNGIIVNGERRIVAHLQDGDRILLGDIELRFETGNRTITQLLSPFPPLGSRQATPPAPSTPSPPKPNPQPAKTASPLPAAKPVAPPVKKRGKLAALLASLRRPQPTEPTENPATLASREEIRSELARTFGKMGLDMPNPPPPPTRKRPST